MTHNQFLQGLKEIFAATSKTWHFILPLALLTYYIISTTRSYLHLRHFKGPPLAGISSLWMIQAAVRNRTYLSLSEACDKYGRPFLSQHPASIQY